MTRSERVGSDTVRPAWHTRWCAAISSAALRGLLVGAAGALLGCMLPLAACAELRTLDAQVIWARPGWCYLASADSTLFTTGIAIVIARGDRVLAEGRITRLLEPRLAAVRLESGGLEDQDHLEALRVRGESARDVRMTHLRVGLPSASRRNLLFACDRITPRLGFASETYDLAGDRMLRRLMGPTLPLAPDTLDVLWFADANDADIAIERGDIDVAVFWPGELPARLRAPDHAARVFAGERSHGVLAAQLTPPDTLPLPGSDMAWLTREAFASDAHLVAAPPGEPTATRYKVDPAIPGAATLQRVLTHVNRASAKRTVMLRWLDEVELEPQPPSGRGMATRVVGAATRVALREHAQQPLLTMTFAVVASPAARAAVAAIGADSFAELIECARLPR